MRKAGIIKRVVVGLALGISVAFIVDAGCMKTVDDAERMYRSHAPVFQEIVALMRAHPELRRVDGPEGYDEFSLDREYRAVYQGKYPSFAAELEAVRPIYMRVAKLTKSIGVQHVQTLTKDGLPSVFFHIDDSGLLDHGERLGSVDIYYDENPRGLHTAKRSSGQPACRPLPDRFWYVCHEDLH